MSCITAWFHLLNSGRWQEEDIRPVLQVADDERLEEKSMLQDAWLSPRANEFSLGTAALEEFVRGDGYAGIGPRGLQEQCISTHLMLHLPPDGCLEKYLYGKLAPVGSLLRERGSELATSVLVVYACDKGVLGLNVKVHELYGKVLVHPVWDKNVDGDLNSECRRWK
eukprot:6300025-Amphidinium_carterae.1